MTSLPTLQAASSLANLKESGWTDVVPVFQTGDKEDKRAVAPKGSPYTSLIEKFGKGGAFVAACGSIQFLRFAGLEGAENVLLVGLGGTADLTEEKARSAGGNAWNRLAGEKIKATAAVHTKNLPVKMVRAFAEGLILGNYQLPSTKKEAPKDVAKPGKLVFVAGSSKGQDQLKEIVDQVGAIGESVNVTRDWSNLPSNIGTPEYYAGEAQKLAKKHGLKCKILTEADARKEGMGLFLGVGQGSDRESRVIVVEYNPRAAKKSKTIALVGKGVTFDSGGISIKPSLRMEEMKHDMTGAATVMGAIILASKWKVQNRIVAFMGFTENMPGGDAIQPGNVLTSRAGKTVEVINTDAEGRLVLGDLLDYAQDYAKPDVVVDVATLTGAVSVALGKLCCGILGNDDRLIAKVKAAGDACGERMWQLPLFDEYMDDLKSDWADMKNSANDANGGTIRGAIFLKQFIRKGTRWAHLDIASTAYNVGHLSYFPKKGANGAFVRTLATLAGEI